MLAELLITPTGIGDLITFHRSRADYAEMYATIASIIALSTLTLVALQWVEVRVFRPEKEEPEMRAASIAKGTIADARTNRYDRRGAGHLQELRQYRGAARHRPRLSRAAS